MALVGHHSAKPHTVPIHFRSCFHSRVSKFPTGVAVDTAGNTYVTDYFTHQVWKLAAGATVPTPLPLTGLNNPNGVTVDPQGNLYVTDEGNNRAPKLAPGRAAQPCCRSRA